MSRQPSASVTTPKTTNTQFKMEPRNSIMFGTPRGSLEVTSADLPLMDKSDTKNADAQNLEPNRYLQRRNAFLTLYTTPITLDVEPALQKQKEPTSWIRGEKRSLPLNEKNVLTEKDESSQEVQNRRRSMSMDMTDAPPRPSRANSIDSRERAESKSSRSSMTSAAAATATIRVPPLPLPDGPAAAPKASTPMSNQVVTAKSIISILTSPSDRTDAKEALAEIIPYAVQIVISDEELTRSLSKAFQNPGTLRKREMTDEERNISRRRILEFLDRWVDVRGEEIRRELDRTFDAIQRGHFSPRGGGSEVKKAPAVMQKSPSGSKVHWPSPSQVDRDFAEVDPLSFVEEYCMFEMKLFIDIPAGAFCSSQLIESSMAATRFLDNWKRFHDWMERITKSGKIVQDKARDLTKLIQIARHFLDMQNYSAFTAVMEVLRDSKTQGRIEWSYLAPHIADIWDDLMAQSGAEEGYKAFRARVKEATPPCIPYLQLFISDMKHIEDLYSSGITTQGVPLPMFVSLGRLARMLATVQQFDKELPYEWEHNEKILGTIRAALEVSSAPPQRFIFRDSKLAMSKQNSAVSPRLGAGESDDDSTTARVAPTPAASTVDMKRAAGSGKPRLFKSFESLFSSSWKKPK